MPWRSTYKTSHIYFLCLILLLLLASGEALGSQNRVSNFLVPYTSYTYDFWENAVPAPQAYLPSIEIGGEDLGIGSLRDPRDLHVSPTGNIYIADTGNNRIVAFDGSWNLIQELSTFTNDGSEDSFNQPRGVFVAEDDTFYVADSNNARIVHFDPNGEFIRVIGEPESDVEGILPQGFNYRPQKVAVDGHGRIYVISQDLMEGFVSYSQDGQFRGFVGAPRVTPNFTDYIWSRLATREQRERMQVFLPTEYTNLTVDPEGYIYATIQDEDEDEDSGERRDKVARLNARGENLLRGMAFHPPIGDIEYPDQFSSATRTRSSIFVDVTVHEHGIYSVLDRNRGRVFTYDNNDNLLFVFGFQGTEHGQLNNAVAIGSIGKTMLVLDSRQNAINVYEPTEYGLLIWSALDAYNRGDYTLTENIWRKVLQLNANYDLAYSGIGNALLRREEYADALYYFELGNDRSGYSKAFELYRRGVIYDNFTRVSLIVLGLIVLFIVYKIIRRVKPPINRKQVAATQVGKVPFAKRGRLQRYLHHTWVSLKYSLHTIFHANEGFYLLKYEKKGSLSAAMIILAALAGTFIFSRQYTGFIFNTVDLTRLNVPMEIASVVVPFFLWCAVNWALTTLMEGKGTFRDVVIASAYALVPLILTIIPLTVLSNYLIEREGAFYYFGLALGTLWTVILVVFGAVMTTHEYDFPKTIWTCIFTIAGMAFSLFLGFLFFNLSEQVYTFINDIITEFVFRT